MTEKKIKRLVRLVMRRLSSSWSLDHFPNLEPRRWGLTCRRHLLLNQISWLVSSSRESREFATVTYGAADLSVEMNNIPPFTDGKGEKEEEEKKKEVGSSIIAFTTECDTLSHVGNSHRKFPSIYLIPLEFITRPKNVFLSLGAGAGNRPTISLWWWRPEKKLTFKILLSWRKCQPRACIYTALCSFFFFFLIIKGSSAWNGSIVNRTKKEEEKKKPRPNTPDVTILPSGRILGCFFFLIW